jgi:GTPase SAR1 family protein
MKSYKILVLGASGSGKTVFLASLYEKLSVQRKEIGFYLELPEREHLILVQKYNEIADPLRPWPAGTRRHEVSTWQFTNATQASGTHFPLFQFTYWDYAGERLTEPGADGEATFALSREAQQADALLMLLDGQKILYMMNGVTQNTLPPLNHDLSYILPIINQVGFKPVHFVITKWDLLEEQYTLAEIRRRLLADDKMAAVIEMRRPYQIPTRLIPVSSVGTGFARLNRQGQMVKVNNGRPRPFQVEMPLACTLVDGFQSARLEMQQQRQSKMFALKMLLWRLLELVGLLGGIAAEYMPLPPQYRLGKTVIGILVDYLQEGLSKSVKRLEVEHDAAIAAIRDRETAMESVLISYRVLMSKLESNFPESDFYRV